MNINSGQTLNTGLFESLMVDIYRSMHRQGPFIFLGNVALSTLFLGD